MTLKKYEYALLIIVLFAIWCVNLLNFLSVEEIWLYTKLIYLICCPFCIFGYLLELFPGNTNANTKKTCDICGEYITMNEDSIHYRPANNGDNTEDYCEKCKSKIALNL